MSATCTSKHSKRGQFYNLMFLQEHNIVSIDFNYRTVSVSSKKSLSRQYGYAKLTRYWREGRNSRREEPTRLAEISVAFERP
ncbi:hypothetical protein WN55_08718 [Dufourea novaeangliae]|uniref:Uncharacterized protein n=1 Tax=Dufourea novaeangliae TaxID=178035 RepID=A0A154NZS3_DUFNO|nr:hypothetical protein WN55_08718 [Dufourea novaeangliae]